MAWLPLTMPSSFCPLGADMIATALSIIFFMFAIFSLGNHNGVWFFIWLALSTIACIKGFTRAS